MRSPVIASSGSLTVQIEHCAPGFAVIDNGIDLGHFASARRRGRTAAGSIACCHEY
jgi:hypothetical protein